MRIAAIDIGTNSIHMVIAQATGPGAFEVIDREREVVQIGRGSFGSGRLRPDAIQRTVEALTRFVQIARRQQVDKIVCTATAAVREARNGGDFLDRAKAMSGVVPRVIPGQEEGRLIYLGVKNALQLDPAPALMVDIGGGSAQLVVGDRDRMMFATSASLGALRLTEELLESDPPSRPELARLERRIRKALKGPLASIAAHAPRRAYGSSGSIHALAHIAHFEATGEAITQINGHVLALEALAKLTRKLTRLSAAEREKLPGIDAKRAEIIVPGALVLTHVLEELGLDGITISDYGVREGLVGDWIARHARELARPAAEDLRLRSVVQLAEKFQVDLPHAEHVTKLALALYDGLQPVHELDAGARETLHFAGLLHDVGSAIAFDGHAEHSYYVIKHGNLRGLSAEEIERVANVARFHSKRKPRKREPGLRELGKDERKVVRWLAAVLRIAEGLDRSHYQLIRSLRVRRTSTGVSILVAARREAQLELWSARRRADVLEKLAGGAVRIALDPAVEKPRTAALVPEPPAPVPVEAGAVTKPGRRRPARVGKVIALPRGRATEARR